MKIIPTGDKKNFHLLPYNGETNLSIQDDGELFISNNPSKSDGINASKILIITEDSRIKYDDWWWNTTLNVYGKRVQSDEYIGNSYMKHSFSGEAHLKKIIASNISLVTPKNVISNDLKFICNFYNKYKELPSGEMIIVSNQKEVDNQRKLHQSSCPVFPIKLIEKAIIEWDKAEVSDINEDSLDFSNTLAKVAEMAEKTPRSKSAKSIIESLEQDRIVAYKLKDISNLKMVQNILRDWLIFLDVWKDDADISKEGEYFAHTSSFHDAFISNGRLNELYHEVYCSEVNEKFEFDTKIDEEANKIIESRFNKTDGYHKSVYKEAFIKGAKSESAKQYHQNKVSNIDSEEKVKYSNPSFAQQERDTIIDIVISKCPPYKAPKKEKISDELPVYQMPSDEYIKLMVSQYRVTIASFQRSVKLNAYEQGLRDMRADMVKHFSPTPNNLGSEDKWVSVEDMNSKILNYVTFRNTYDNFRFTHQMIVKYVGYVREKYDHLTIIKEMREKGFDEVTCEGIHKLLFYKIDDEKVWEWADEIIKMESESIVNKIPKMPSHNN